MRYSALLFLLIASYLGCAYSDYFKPTTGFLINGTAMMKAYGTLSSQGGPFGYQISWNLETSDYVQIGPYVMSNTNGDLFVSKVVAIFNFVINFGWKQRPQFLST